MQVENKSQKTRMDPSREEVHVIIIFFQSHFCFFYFARETQFGRHACRSQSSLRYLLDRKLLYILFFI